MPRRAARIDENQPGIVKALRRTGCKVLSLASLGQGCPDLLVCNSRGQLFLLEVKDENKPPSKRKLTPMQVELHQEWPVTVVFNAAQAIEAVYVTRRPIEA